MKRKLIILLSFIMAGALTWSFLYGALSQKERNVSYAAGIFYDTETKVTDKLNAGEDFNILEIVNDVSNANIGSDGIKALLKNHVFGNTASATALNINVTAKAAGDLTAADFNSGNIDLIYFSGNNVDNYLNNDISEEGALELLRRVTAIDSENPVPLVIDYIIYEKAYDWNFDDDPDTDPAATWANSNLYKVTAFLLSENIENAFSDIEGNFSEDVNAEDGVWKSVLQSVVKLNDGNFVRSNIYWYDFVAEDFMDGQALANTRIFASDNIGFFFNAGTISAGFGPVVDAIDRENYNNSISHPDRPSIPLDEVSPALVLQYILNYRKTAGIIYKDTLNVLEIEPCKAYSFAGSDKATFISRYLSDFTGKPENVYMHYMTIQEFIGHNEDITEQYDIIYIGSNIDYYNKATESVDYGNGAVQRTYKKYTDTSMTGLVYTHVGDLGYLPYFGLIKSDVSNTNKTQYRYPGTDLTTYKYKQLKQFLDNGCPIIVADDFFTYGNTESPVVSGAPTGYNAGNSVVTANGTTLHGILDTSSYIYQLMVYAITGQDEILNPQYMAAPYNTGRFNWSQRFCKNLFSASIATSGSLLNYVNEQKLFLNLTSKPTEYSYTTAGSHHYIDSATYLEPASDGHFYLNYEFSISGLGSWGAGNSYDAELFIDINNDGKYSKTQEKMDALRIVNLYTGETVAMDGGHYNLASGTPYRLSRAVPTDFLGCVSWELLVKSNLNPGIHDSRTGYTLVKEDRTKKERLRILQVTSGFSTEPAPGYNGNGVNANNLNLERELARGTGIWGELLNNIPDFELEITTIPTYGENGLVNRFINNNNIFNDYDMLIFGFGDGFADIRYIPLLNAIETYANSGHCILFAHDDTFVQTAQLTDYYDYDTAGDTVRATSDINLFGGYGGGWGDGLADARPRYLTQYVRKISGMDTYGVTENGSIVRSGQSINKYTDASRTAITANWNTLLSSGKDIAYAPNSYRESTVPNTQGATYIQLREWLIPFFQNWSGNTDGRTAENTFFGYDIQSRAVFKGLHTQDSAEGYVGTDINCPTLVEKINDGMITNYPYKIADNFYGSNTHSQYWALDIERDIDSDGESDLVVWYTIADYTTSDNNYYADDLSSLSPRDARNNYYIYNMGNITYTGVGHTGNITEQEAKLFINTMVASYIGSIKDPKVSIMEDGSAYADEKESLVIPYIPGSAADTAALTGDSERVYFNVADNNIVRGSKTIHAAFYLDGSPRDLTVYDTRGNAIYTAGSGSIILQSGNTYYVELPISDIMGPGTNEFEVSVYTDWVRNNQRIVSDTVSDSLMISKVELFDLD